MTRFKKNPFLLRSRAIQQPQVITEDDRLICLNLFNVFFPICIQIITTWKLIVISPMTWCRSWAAAELNNSFHICVWKPDWCLMYFAQVDITEPISVQVKMSKLKACLGYGCVAVDSIREPSVLALAMQGHLCTGWIHSNETQSTSLCKMTFDPNKTVLLPFDRLCF